MTFMTFISSLHQPGDRSLRRSQSRKFKHRPDPNSLSFPSPPRESEALKTGVYQTFHNRYGFPPIRNFSTSHPFPGNLPPDWPLESADYYESYRPKEGYVQIGGHVRGVTEKEYRKTKKSGGGWYQARGGYSGDSYGGYGGGEYGGWRERAAPPTYSMGFAAARGGYHCHPVHERERARMERDMYYHDCSSSEDSVDSYHMPGQYASGYGVGDYSQFHHDGGWGDEKRFSGY